MPTRFAALDGWRGICAIIVVLYHFAPPTSHIGSMAVVANGFLFVDFFFVLSGFVILHAYGPRLSSPKEVGTFIWSRFARLWPLHAVLIGLLICLELARAAVGTSIGPVSPAFSGHFPLSTLPSQFLFLEGLGLNPALTWNGPAWSVASEFLVAVLLSLICVSLSERYRAWAFLGGAVIALFVIARFSPRHMDTAHDFGFARCAAGFFSGALCYLWWANAVWSNLSQPRRTATALELAAVALVVLFVAVSGTTAVSLLAPLVFGIAVSVFADGRGWLSHALQWQSLQTLGAWSFSIYMLQTPLAMLVYFPLRLAEKLFPTGLRPGPEAEAGFLTHAGSGLMADIQILAFLALLVPAARLAHRHVERPAQACLHGLVKSSAQ